MTREEELITVGRVLAGENEAFEILVIANQKKIYNRCLRIVKNPEDANDLAQDAFLKAYQNLASFKGESGFSLWLYRLTTNVCLDFLRREKRREKVSLSYQDDAGDTIEIEVPDERFTPHKEAERNEFLENIHQGLTSLSDEHRKILMMRELDGLSYDEIAAFLGLSPGTVKSRIARARQNLTKILLEDGNFSDYITSNKHVTLGKGG